MLDKSTLAKLKEYVSDYLNEDDSNTAYQVYESIESHDLIDYVTHHQKPTFQQVLFQFIDEKGISDATIYKKAWIDRRHFSKIRSNPDYQIGKNTAIALCMALELSLEEADKLLHAAGFTLSDSHTNDLVIQFCLNNHIYDLHDVNQSLEYLNLKPLINL